MDRTELITFFPDFIARYLDDVSTPQPIAPGPIHDEHPSWTFGGNDVLTTVAVNRQDPPQLRITAGLLIDVPYTAEVSHAVNRCNNKELYFGRMFLFGNDESGRGCVAMQEIVVADALSSEHVGSLQHLLRVVGTLMGQGSRLAKGLQEQFGGRPFVPEDAFFLLTNG